jgi:hypothetical protein
MIYTVFQLEQATTEEDLFSLILCALTEEWQVENLISHPSFAMCIETKNRMVR